MRAPSSRLLPGLLPGLLLLEDGTVFEGEAVSPGTRFGEVVFNTSMTGYQEVLTDPSYRGQIVVMTQPHIGNYGTTPELAESARPWAEGFLARQLHRRALRPVPRGESLVSYLRQHDVPALQGFDTRALVRRLRERGALRGVSPPSARTSRPSAAELADFPIDGRPGAGRRGDLRRPPARSPRPIRGTRAAATSRSTTSG